MKNGRCRMHGGKSTGPPKGSQNGLKHGIYSKALNEDDRRLYESMAELGSIEHEIRVARVRLYRALAAQARIDELHGARDTEKMLAEALVTDVTITGRGDRPADRKITRKVPDYSYEIRRYIRIIADLEVKRYMMLGVSKGPQQILEELRHAIDATRDPFLDEDAEPVTNGHGGVYSPIS